MQLTETIEVRKVYIGSAAKFGLLFGLLIGLITGVTVLISNLFPGVNFGSDILENFGLTGASSVFIFAGVVFVLTFMSIFLISVLLSTLYNLVSELGGKLHLGLAETEKEDIQEANKYKNIKLAMPNPNQKEFDVSKLV